MRAEIAAGRTVGCPTVTGKSSNVSGVLEDVVALTGSLGVGKDAVEVALRFATSVSTELEAGVVCTGVGVWTGGICGMGGKA